MVELTIPFPPSTNHYWRHAAVGRHGVKVYISAEGKAFREAVAKAVAESGIACQRGAVGLRVVLYCPDWRARDADNACKALFDAIVAAGLIQGDEFVAAVVIEKRKSADDEGRAVVQVSRLADGVEVKNSGAWLS